jgi:RNA polymerase sigma-70 factor (ECF subfamily)
MMKPLKGAKARKAGASDAADPAANQKGIVRSAARCVRELQAKDVSDFREQMIVFLPRLAGFAYSLTGNADQRDDLVQETCLRAFAHKDQWQPGTRFDSWIFRIAQNLWLDWKRAAKFRGQSVEIEAAENQVGSDGHAVTESRLALGDVLRGLDQLSPEHRLLIGLVCVDGLTYKEAAEVLDVPVGTVMSRLARARLVLHDAINPAPAAKAITTLERRRGRNCR